MDKTFQEELKTFYSLLNQEEKQVFKMRKLSDKQIAEKLKFTIARRQAVFREIRKKIFLSGFTIFLRFYKRFKK